LPRPIGITDLVSDGAVILVYAVVGAGTRAISRLQTGETIEAMGPLGIGFFDFEDFTPNDLLLIGGGTGIPPLRFAARWLREKAQIKVRAWLGYARTPWYIREFETLCDDVYVTSDTANMAAHHGNVISLLEHTGAKILRGARGEDAYFSPGDVLAIACGPRPMLMATAAWCAEHGLDLRVSLEERMGCGYGACAACTCKTVTPPGGKPAVGPRPAMPNGIVKKKICAHGPAFWGDEIVW
jgi:dihydroorotate dehydrogenase electron transfer subunit